MDIGVTQGFGFGISGVKPIPVILAVQALNGLYFIDHHVSYHYRERHDIVPPSQQHE